MITRNRARWRDHLFAADNRESGVAMVMTLGIMLVGAIILTTLAMVTMYSTQNTARNRVEMRALASADAGIDIVLSQLEGLKYNQLHQVCTQNNLVINNEDLDIAISYVVKRGSTSVPVACPAASDITTLVTVHATATATAPVMNGDYVSRTVVATFVPTPPEVLLDKAIFSEGSTTITNNSKLYESSTGANDAHIYSNGGVTCQTQVDAGGSIYAAQGNVDIQNTCHIKNSVWASGKVTLSSQSSVAGDVYAADASTTGISLANSTALIRGNALTNGGIYNEGRGVVTNPTGSSPGGIMLTAFARTGGITLQNQAEIGGSAYAGGTIAMGNQGRIGHDAMARGGTITSNNGSIIGGYARATGTIATTKITIGGTIAQNAASLTFPTVPNPADTFPSAVGFPNVIQAPPREQMPRISMTATDLALWQAAGWTVETVTNKCTGNDPANIVQSGAWTPGSSGRIVIFAGCSSPVTFNNHSLTIKGGLVLVSNTGFASQNLHFVQSDDHSQRRDVYWIVPSDAPGVTWTSVGAGQYTPSCSGSAGNIAIDKIKNWAVNFMFYTPCTFRWQNGTDLGGGSEPFTGQMYAGKVELPNATEMHMHTMPVPSLAVQAPNSNDEANMRLTSRFDLHG